MSDSSILLLSPSVVWVLRRSAFALGLAAVALSYFGHRFGWLDYRPGGAAFDTDVRPVFTGLFILSLLLALKWELVGGALAGFAGAALIAFAAKQLVPTHAVSVVALFLVPAFLWLMVDLADVTPRRALFAAFATAIMVGAGLVAGERVYDYIWGPTHPESTLTDRPTSAVQWVWSGAVTSSTAEIRSRPERDDYESARLALAKNAELEGATFIDARDESGRVVGFELVDLEPDTDYFYAVEIDGEIDLIRSGTFRTFPDDAASFTVAIGSCARVGSNGRVFDTIRELDPLLYLITGDLHYGDNGENDIGRYQEVMDLTLSMPAQAALYQSAPVAYMWDDHDYGGNDTDGNSPSRQAAMAAYREHVPSYGLSGDESAIYQAFSIGRVRFILTDARSARNLDNDDNSDAPSMLGLEQKLWLKEELSAAAQTHELVVWVNPVPWIADAEDGADHWGGYAAERQELADHIATNSIDNLLMVAGDAHMLAIDDGSNTDYSSDGYPGFPLIHSAALDRLGSVKGGPYSEGAIPGGGHFATMDVLDDGESITVELTGLDWEGTELVSYEFSTES